MLIAARNSGIDEIVCTPHCRGGRFDYDKIVQNFGVLAEFAEQQGVRMILGFEVYWEKLAELGMENAPYLCFEGTNLLLLEFSPSFMPANWQRVVYDLQGMGIQPIIAHPERYHAVQNDIGVAEEMKRMGCLLQLSGNFSNGGFRSPSKKAAIEMLKADMIDYIASDAHCVEDYTDYRQALQIARKY